MQHYALLSRDEVEQIHETSLQILEKIGLDLFYEPARTLLARIGARVEGNRVRFPPRLVEEQLNKAPSHFTLYARNPKHNLVIGQGRPHYLPANCPALVHDSIDGQRYGTLKDYNAFVKLSHISPHMDMCSNVLVEPVDVPEPFRHLAMTEACLRLTDKCFMGSCMGAQVARDVLDMLAMVYGRDSLINEPRVMSIPCSMTPLCYDSCMLGTLMEYARAGQPVMVNAITMAGASAPVTMAGALSLQNAEVLAGIVLAQAVREGTPVVYASGSSTVDFRTGSFSVGSPEMSMNNVLTAQMARYYNLPCRGAGALTDSPVPDAQAGYESMLNLSMAVSSGVDIILHAAGSLETLKCMSYEKFVLDEELISMMKRVRQGVHVGKESLALEVIAEVGPGGQFLDHDHTFEHFREEIYLPTVSTRDSFSDWLGHGAYYTEKRARTRSMFLLESYTAPDFSDSLARDLNAFIERHGACGPVREAGGLL